MTAPTRRRVLTSVAGVASCGLAGCAGGGGGADGGDDSPASSDGAVDAPPADSFPSALSRDRAAELRGAAVDRAGIYDHFRSLFSQQENVERVTEATMDPLNALLESTGITDRWDADPPATAVAVDIAPLPDPIDALATATEIVTAVGNTAGINGVLDCGAYHDATATCGFDAAVASAADARARNETLATAAGDPVDGGDPTGVVEALDEYRTAPGEGTLAAVREALRAEYEATAPLPALRAWARIVQSPYGEIADSTDAVDYVDRVTRANAASIVGLRAEIADQLSELGAPPEGDATGEGSDDAEQSGNSFTVSDVSGPAKALVDERFTVTATVANPTEETRTEDVFARVESGPRAAVEGRDETLEPGAERTVGRRIRVVEPGTVRYRIATKGDETDVAETEIVEDE